MVPLRVEQASLVFRQCASAPRHGLSPRGFFLATRNISWSRSQVRQAGDTNKLVRRKRVVPLRRSNNTIQPTVTPTVVDKTLSPVQSEDPEQQVTLNYFEADADDKSKKDQIDIADLEGVDKDLEDEERGLDERIRDLEEDINQSVFPTTEDIFAKELFRSEEARQRVIDGIDQNWDELVKVSHHINAWEGLSDTSEIFLRNINSALSEVSLDPSSDKARIELWRWYARSKIYIKDFLSHVPEEAWQLLWLSQSEDSPQNPNRAAHLKVLAEDMAKVGRGLSQEQRYSRLEGLFMNGQQEKALEEWELALRSGDGAIPDFLELGVRMYAHQGNVSRALELKDLLLVIHNTWHPDLFLSVLSVLLGSNAQSSHQQKALEFYQDIRRRFGAKMGMQDYDAIGLAFLKSGNRDWALMVFRDMMMAGDVAEAKSHSFVRQIQHRVGDLLQAGRSASKVNDFMLNNMTYLPRQYQNKFFFAKWLRKLISMDEVDAAAMVIELMYERGINPDAIHVNGIIGAWIRQDTNETRKKAEDMAWAMIETRLEFVADRRRKKDPLAISRPHSVHDNKEEGVEVPTWVARRTPSATIETFCIMVQYYLHKEAFSTVRHLRNLLAYAEIPMNSVFMNHLLYAELRYRTYADVWQRFDILSRSVVPDIETWICLWEGEKQEILESANPRADFRNPQKARYPKPRQLFARMMQWRAGLHGKHLRDALEDMEADTYNDILRCFCLTRDLPGVFVAMRAMSDKFMVWPDPSTVRMLLLQISKMGTIRNRPGRRLLKPGKDEVEANMAKTTEVLAVITQYRREQLEKKGIDFDNDLEEPQRAEETLRTLLQFVFTIAQRMTRTPTVFQAQLESATRDMLVEQIDGDRIMELVA